MRLIELLTMKANKQELPKKILIHDKVYYLLKVEEEYVYSLSKCDVRDWESQLDHTINVSLCLNDEVIILDNETKIIEDEPKGIGKINLYYSVDNTIEEINAKLFDNLCSIIENQRTQEDKINELIKVVNNLDK